MSTNCYMFQGSALNHLIRGSVLFAGQVQRGPAHGRVPVMGQGRILSSQADVTVPVLLLVADRALAGVAAYWSWHSSPLDAICRRDRGNLSAAAVVLAAVASIAMLFLPLLGRGVAASNLLQRDGPRDIGLAAIPVAVAGAPLLAESDCAALWTAFSSSCTALVRLSAGLILFAIMLILSPTLVGFALYYPAFVAVLVAAYRWVRPRGHGHIEASTAGPPQ
jgi:hypothetical protein